MHPWMMLALSLYACGAASPGEPPASAAAAPSAPAVTVALRFVEGPEDDALGTPSTRVLLVDIDQTRGRRTSDLGSYPGVCSHLRAGDGVLLRAQCFWVGQGSRLEVVREGDELLVTRAVLDERGRAGDANVLLRTDLPPGAEVHVLAPVTRLGAEL